MKLQDHYDWIVFGNHPGGLLSASLVARMGFSVLILPQSSGMSAFLSKSGQRFDPESNYLMGLGKLGSQDGLIRQCLSKLGILPNEQGWIRADDCKPHVLTSKNRLVLTSPELLTSEFQREWGETTLNQLGLLPALQYMELPYLKFWSDLPNRLTLNKERKPNPVEPMTLRSLRKSSLQKMDSSSSATTGEWIFSERKISSLALQLNLPHLVQLFEALGYAVTSGSTADPQLPDLLHSLILSRVGGTFRGGLTAYREFLITLAKRQGVQVLPETECRRFFIEHGKFSGVQITQSGNMISTGGGILGFSFDKITSRLTYTGRSWLRRNRKPLVPSGWKFTLAFTVREDGIPPGMSSRAVLQEKDAPILELEVVSPSDYQQHEPNSKILYLRTWMPFTPESLNLTFQRLIAARMLRRAMEILPFLELHIVRVFPEFRPELQSGWKELSDLYGFASLDHVPNNLLTYAGQGRGAETGIDGLFVAAEESYPELGTLGPTVAALESAAWLAHRSGLAGPFV